MSDVNLEAVVVAKKGAHAVEVGVLVHDHLEALLASEGRLPRLLLAFMPRLALLHLQRPYQAGVQVLPALFITSVLPVDVVEYFKSFHITALPDDCARVKRTAHS